MRRNALRLLRPTGLFGDRSFWEYFRPYRCGAEWQCLMGKIGPRGQITATRLGILADPVNFVGQAAHHEVVDSASEFSRRKGSRCIVARRIVG